MAMTPAQVGGGSGFVYVTKADGTTLASNIENTADAWAQVQRYISAPLADPTLQVDATFGYRIFGNTAGAAGSLAGATELTRFFVNRASQSAGYKKPITIVTGVVTVDRVGNNMTLIVATEGGLADTLNTLTVTDVVDNDTVTIIGVSAGAGDIVIVDDSAGNIFLANGANFVTGARYVQLVLRYYSAAVAGWYEVSRSNILPTVANQRLAVVPTEIAGANTTALVSGTTYDLEPGVDKGYQVYTGTLAIAGSITIRIQAAPVTPYLDGDTMIVDYRGLVTVGANAVTIFGQTLSTAQALAGRYLAKATYRLATATWYYQFAENNGTGAAGVNMATKPYVDATFEPDLGLPASDNMVLASTALGVRFWTTPGSATLSQYASVALDTDTTLTAGVSQPILKVTSTSTTTTSANRVITLVPSASAGVNNSFKIIIGVGKIGAGFTWKIKYSATDLISLIPGTFSPTIFDCYWDGATYIVTEVVDVAFGNTDSDVRAQERIYGAEWSFAQSGGAVSTITLPTTFPEGTIVKASEVVIECVEPLTSGGAATVAWGYTGITNAFDAATGFGSAPYTAANLVKYGTPATGVVKLLTNQQVTITIAGAALTGGYIRVFVPVIIDKL